MRENDLPQSRSVHLAKIPPLEPSREAIELGLPEVLGQNLRDKLSLVGDAERLAGGQPRDGMATILAADYGVELLGKIRLAASARNRNGRVELGLSRTSSVAGSSSPSRMDHDRIMGSSHHVDGRYVSSCGFQKVHRSALLFVKNGEVDRIVIICSRW